MVTSPVGWSDTTERERAVALDVIAAMRGVEQAGWHRRRHGFRILFDADGIYKVVLDNVEISTRKVT